MSYKHVWAYVSSVLFILILAVCYFKMEHMLFLKRELALKLKSELFLAISFVVFGSLVSNLMLILSPTTKLNRNKSR